MYNTHIFIDLGQHKPKYFLAFFLLATFSDLSQPAGGHERCFWTKLASLIISSLGIKLIDWKIYHKKGTA